MSRNQAIRISQRAMMAAGAFKPKFPDPKDLIKRWKILRGDKVEIIEGKDQGKQGWEGFVYFVFQSSLHRYCSPGCERKKQCSC
jgi:hypothetical protein